MTGKALARRGEMYVMNIVYVAYQKLALFGVPLDRPRCCTPWGGMVSISGGES
jgi:hypothetical protein